MASKTSKVRRKAAALDRLSSLSDLLAKQLNVEVPDVRVTHRDPELAEIQRIEAINGLLENFLKASDVEVPEAGSEEPTEDTPASDESANAGLDEMTKAELLEYADSHGIEVAKSKTKAEIIEAIQGE